MLARIHIMEAFRRCGEDLSLTKQMGHLWGTEFRRTDFIYVTLAAMCRTDFRQPRVETRKIVICSISPYK